ncbi:hypothetical protein MANES_16G128950v8 [Manihot esculenta]|uniref:Uncharacterized protein n=1 Tax=Manihot esculenta TaxID=3983 RepID=A0ACB7GCG0_MANES|nr:hypothetical protein MANES_16G128950v8 [Manihot esculenta]
MVRGFCISLLLLRSSFVLSVQTVESWRCAILLDFQLITGWTYFLDRHMLRYWDYVLGELSVCFHSVLQPVRSCLNKIYICIGKKKGVK